MNVSIINQWFPMDQLFRDYTMYMNSLIVNGVYMNLNQQHLTLHDTMCYLLFQ